VFCDILHRFGGKTPLGVFSDAFPGLKMWVTFACATANFVTHFIISIAVSDRPKTFSAEYSAENYRSNIRPKRIFGKCCRKRKKSFLVTFHFQAIFSHKLCPSTATCNCHPRKLFFSLCKLTFLQCLLPCAEYSLSAEYSAAFSCRIFVFGRNKKIRFRSITNCSARERAP
jgi:hypothetical protein